MVDEVVWEQVFIQVLRVSPSVLLHQRSILIWTVLLSDVQTGEAKKPSNKSEFFPKLGTSKKKVPSI
jgi:hypothetical protein